jgi:hypothetical protein
MRPTKANDADCTEAQASARHNFHHFIVVYSNHFVCLQESEGLLFLVGWCGVYGQADSVIDWK